MSGLERLLGDWRMAMRHVDVSEPVLGKHSYERVLDGAFVLLRFTYERPEFPDALALFTEKRVHYFDVRGVTRVFEVVCAGDGWTMLHLDDGFSQRYTARFVSPDEVRLAGEASFDRGATWRPDFDMTLSRTPPT